MKEYLNNFPQQILSAIETTKHLHFKKLKDNIQQIVFIGIGGSGITSLLLKNYLLPYSKVPFLIVSNELLPPFLHPHSLLIFTSYSGNTQEVIDPLQQSLAKHYTPICLTSGGKIYQIAIQNNLPFIQLPKHLYTRICFSYLLVYQIFILQQHQCIPLNVLQNLQQTALFLTRKQSKIKQLAESLSQQIHTKIPIIYTYDNYQSVAYRIKQQLNENSKTCCWINFIPEIFHNEVMGWYQAPRNFLILFLNDFQLESRFQKKILFLKNFFKSKVQLIEIFPEGNNFLDKHLYYIHLLDWVSYYLACYHQVNPETIPVIEQLKKIP